MPTFEFNLIRDEVKSVKRRRVQLKALTLYLMVCAAGLILVFGKATNDFLDASVKAQDIKRLESDFRATHPDQDDIKEYASLLKYNLSVMSETVGAMESTIGNRNDLSRIMLGISAPLPAKSFITAIRLETIEGKCSFDIAIPMLDTMADIPNAGELIALWNADTSLMEEINNLSATASRRKLISGVPHFILQFSGEVKKRVTS